MLKLNIFIILIMIWTSCNSPNIEREIRLIEAKNSNTNSLHCSVGSNEYSICIKNLSQDTMLLMRLLKNEMTGDCIFASRELHLNFSKDKKSIYAYSGGLEGFNIITKEVYDTLIPHQVKYYNNGEKWNSEESDFIQLYYRYYKLHESKDTPSYFTMLLYELEESRKFKQMPFILPDGKSQIKLPDNLVLKE